LALTLLTFSVHDTASHMLEPY